MPTTIYHIGARDNTVAVAASATIFFDPFMTTSRTRNTEANAQDKLRFAATLSLLTMHVVTNDRAASTLSSRKNALAGGQSVSIAASGTGEFTDTANTDTIAAADLFCGQLVTGAGGLTFTYTATGIAVVPSSGNSVLRTGSVGATTSYATASQTSWSALGSVLQIETAAEANVARIIRQAVTLRNGAAYASANTRPDATTLRTRIGSVNGALAISVAANGTGWFENTADTDAVASGSKINLQVVTGAGVGSLTLQAIDVDLLSGTDGQFTLFHARTLGQATTAATTQYFAPAGSMPATLSTTETDVKTKAQFAYTLSNLMLYASANATTAASTLTMRKNAAAGNQTASIGSAATGLFEDTTNTDAIVAADLINYSLATGAGGAITLRQMGAYGAPTSTAFPDELLDSRRAILVPISVGVGY